MKNCLITSLKASIDDPDNKFEIFGGCNFFARIPSNTTKILIVKSETTGADLKIAGGNIYFTDTNNQNLGKSIHVESGTKEVRVHNAEAEYSMFRLVINGDLTAMNYQEDQSTDLNITGIDFKKMLLYFENMKGLYVFSIGAKVNFNSSTDNLSRFNELGLPYLAVDNPDFHFNTSDMAGYTNLEKLNLNAINIEEAIDISGNINHFGACKKLTELSFFRREKVLGDLDTLASAMVSNGRTSGTLVVNGEGSGIRCSGNVFSIKTITFNSSLPKGYSIS